MNKDLKTIALVSMLELAVLSLMLLCTGCNYETVASRYYASTNSPPNRFKVMSSDYYCMEVGTPDISVTVFNDTQGTNDFMVVNSMNGLAVMYIPKPVKQLENNK